MDSLVVAPPIASTAPTLPSLPFELVHRMIKLTLPRVRFATVRERYDTLLPLCLVNKTWGALAEQELYRHLGFGSREASRMLMARSTTPSGRKQLDGVCSIWIWDNNSGNNLEEMVQACPRLTTLLTTSISGPTTEFDLRLVASRAPNLNELVLDYCGSTIKDPNRPLVFPGLRRLTLSWLNADSCGVGALLSAIDAPKLDTLMIILGEEGEDEEFDQFARSIGRVAPRLKTFGFVSYLGDEMPAAAWSDFTSLETLTLGTQHHLQSILAALPSPLQTLRICPRPDHDIYLPDLLDALRHSPATLDSLKQLRMPPLIPSNPLDDDDDVHGLRTTRAEILQLCAGKDIDVVDGELIPQSDAYEMYLAEVMYMW